jgi:PilZ domain.
VTEVAIAVALTSGRRVTLLPRNGGHSWAGTVRSWSAADDQVVAQIFADADAVSSLDHHQVWLSTVSRMGDEYGVTIFAGRAYAVDRESLKLEGVVRLADERRRRAVRVTGSMVTLPPSGGARLRVATLDISRGAVRLPIGEGGWTYDDPLDLVVHLGDTKSINVVGRMLRVDEETKSVVLGFDYLPAHDAEALDRFALTQLSPSTAGAPPAHDPAHPR